MMIIGIDAHKRSHTAVTIDSNGRQQETKPLAQRHRTTSNS
jgi:transposase